MGQLKMGRTKGNRSWQDKSQKTGLKGVVKKLLPFKSKKVKSRTPKLQAFKNVRPTPTKKNKKSAGITATSTPKSSIKVKVPSKIKHHNPADTTPGAPDFIPLETSPSPAYRRAGRKKSPVERLVTNNGPQWSQTTVHFENSAATIAGDHHCERAQKCPEVSHCHRHHADGGRGYAAGKKQRRGLAWSQEEHPQEQGQEQQYQRARRDQY